MSGMAEVMRPLWSSDYDIPMMSPCFHALYAVFVVRVHVLLAGGNIIEIIDVLDLGAQIPFSQLWGLGETSVCFILRAPRMRPFTFKFIVN